MTDPRHHHFVPQGYQKGFANDRNQVTVVDRHTGETFTSHTRNVFQRRDWNTFEGEHGERFFEVEENLGRIIDGPSAVCFAHLREGELELRPEERFLLCHFMAMQLVRGVQPREQLRRSATEVNNLILSLNATHLTPDQWMERVGEVPTRRTLARMASNPESLGIQPAEGFLSQTLMSHQHEVAEMLEMRTFTVVEFDDDSLFTGEFPFVHINPSGQTMGYGVATAERLYLPVSPRVAIVLSHPWSGWPEGIVNGDAGLAKRLNWAMYSHPNNRQILQHPDTGQFPMPTIFELGKSLHWPWGPDPEASASAHFYSPGDD